MTSLWTTSVWYILEVSCVIVWYPLRPDIFLPQCPSHTGFVTALWQPCNKTNPIILLLAMVCRQYWFVLSRISSGIHLCAISQECSRYLSLVHSWKKVVPPLTLIVTLLVCVLSVISFWVSPRQSCAELLVSRWILPAFAFNVYFQTTWGNPEYWAKWNSIGYGYC